MENPKVMYMLFERHSVVGVWVGGCSYEGRRREHRCSSIIFLVILNMKLVFSL